MESPRWSRSTRFWVSLLCLVGLIWLIIVGAPLFSALIIAGLLAYLLNPLVHFGVARLRLSHNLSALLVYMLFLLLLAAIPTTAGALLFSQFTHWEAEFQEAFRALQDWINQPHVVIGIDISPRLLLARLQESAGGALSAIPGGSLDVISGVSTNFLWVLVILVSLFYLLRDEEKIRPAILGLALPTYQAELAYLLDEINDIWKVFLRVQLLIFFVLAVLMASGSFLVIWLFRAGLLRYSTLGLILMLVLVYALVQQVDNLWLRPRMLSHRLRLHPGLVFIGLIGGLALSGVLGAILVIPVIATAKVVGRYIYCKLTDQPPWPVKDISASTDGQAQDMNLEATKIQSG